MLSIERGCRGGHSQPEGGVEEFTLGLLVREYGQRVWVHGECMICMQ